MNVVIITTRQELYHRYLCAEIARRHRVVAVLHPLPPAAPPRSERNKQHRRDMARYGRIWHLLRKLARNRVKSFGWDRQADVAAAERRYFPNASSDYDKLVASIARDVADINSPQSIELLRSLQPSVVVCSGGPIYEAALIEAAGTMLNFHTGISPIYNGSWTVFWTYANRQPHLTGGTLMKMSTTVDGGDVLAHYLPAVEPDDTPGSLMMKTISGGVGLYNRFLDGLAAGRPYVAVPQGQPFHHYYDYEWTVYQTLAIERHIRNGICARHVRREIIAEYWRHGDSAAAKRAMQQTLLELIAHE